MSKRMFCTLTECPTPSGCATGGCHSPIRAKAAPISERDPLSTSAEPFDPTAPTSGEYAYNDPRAPSLEGLLREAESLDPDRDGTRSYAERLVPRLATALRSSLGELTDSRSRAERVEQELERVREELNRFTQVYGEAP